ERRARLERVRANGAALDLDAIATATAADERGRAYLGRYLVAVTVLVGLVRTFAGLMDTVRGGVPLLRHERPSTAPAPAGARRGAWRRSRASRWRDWWRRRARRARGWRRRRRGRCARPRRRAARRRPRWRRARRPRPRRCNRRRKRRPWRCNRPRKRRPRR